MPRGKDKDRYLLARLQSQTKVIRWVNHMLFICAGLALGAVVFATYFPESRNLAVLEKKLADTEQRERVAQADREYHEAELKAMKGDREFLELKAMDRTNFHRPGEKVFRINREAPQP